MSATESIGEAAQKFQKQFFGDGAGRKMLGEQMERFWRTEDEMVSDVREFVDNWCERRHDAARSAIDFAAMMTDGADQSQIVEAWSAMSSDAVKRFSEDAQAQMELFQKMAFKAVPSSFSLFLPGLPGSAASEEEKPQKSKKLSSV